MIVLSVVLSPQCKRFVPISVGRNLGLLSHGNRCRPIATVESREHNTARTERTEGINPLKIYAPDSEVELLLVTAANNRPLETTARHRY